MDFRVSKDPRLKLSMVSPFTRGSGNGNALLKWERVRYFFWARSAIYQGLSALGIERGKDILVPAYHCKVMIHPILLYGGKVKYYNVRRNCTLDEEDLISKVDDDTRAIMVVHYFGFPQSLHVAKELCRMRNLPLVEDCAHVLPFDGAVPVLGRSGDIGVFSLRKYFPFYDGGALVVNRQGLSVSVKCRENKFPRLRETKNLLDRLVMDSERETLKDLYGGFSSLLKRCLGTGDRRGEDHVGASHDPFSEEMSMEDAALGMSKWSKRIFDRADVASIVSRRRANYDHYLKAFRGCDRIKIFFPDLADGICPLVFPFAVEGTERFHLELREKGIPATTWGGVIHPGCPTGDFPDTEYLYENLIMLPVHQSLTEDDLRYVCETTLKAIR